MSLSNKRSLSSPVTKYYQWRGNEGTLSYYDKELRKNVPIALPLNFVVLDQLSMIKGFSDDYQGSFSSNEVRSVKDTLRVICYGKNNKNETKTYNIAEGSYETIKDQIKSVGARYTKSVYVVIIDDKNDLELVNFQLMGSALAPLFEARINDDGHVIRLGVNPEQKVKGKSTYYEPTFTKLAAATDEVMKQLVEMDEELQSYLKDYLTRNNEIKEIDDEPDLDSEDYRATMLLGSTFPSMD